MADAIITRRGGGGGMSVAWGTEQTALLTTGSVHTVTGIGFKPKHLMVYARLTFSGYNFGGIVVDGEVVRDMTTVASNLTVTEDGFSFKLKSSTYAGKYWVDWLAVG